MHKITKGFSLVRDLVRNDLNRSYSQEGEDLILLRIFSGRKDGFYVDVGAHHPKRFSNTCMLYNEGWCGINIDAMPGSMAPFRRLRPRDINLETGVGIKAGVLKFHVFKEAALNTFDSRLAEERRSQGWPMTGTVDVEVLGLAVLLRKHRPAGVIDLLTIDAEGFDEDVLRSLNMPEFLPQVIVTEHMNSAIHDVISSSTAELLTGNGYQLFAKLCNSAIWTRGTPNR